MTRFFRDEDGDLWIEIPSRPEMFAKAEEFQRGTKYVERWAYSLDDLLAANDVLVEEWSDNSTTNAREE